MKEIVSLLQYLIENPVATFTTIMAIILIVTWFVFWMTRKVTKLSASQEYLEKDQKLVLNCICKITDKMENLSSRVDAMSEKMDAQFKQMNERFEQVDKRFEQVDKRFEQVDKKFEQLDQKIENLSEQLKQNTIELKSDIAYLKGKMKGMQIRNVQPKFCESSRRVVGR